MSFDHLHLGKDDKVRKILQEQSDTIYDEIILYSNHVTKINRKAKPQQRVLLITDKAIYNFTPLSAKKRSFSIRNIFADSPHKRPTTPPPPSSHNSVGQLKRRIIIEDIYTISVSAIVHQVVLHVPNEYDYLYRCNTKRDIEQIVRTLTQTASAMEPPHTIKCWSFELNNLSEISENAKTKSGVKESQSQYLQRKVTQWKQQYNVKEYEPRSRSIIQHRSPSKGVNVKNKRKHFKSRSAMVFSGGGVAVGNENLNLNGNALGAPSNTMTMNMNTYPDVNGPQMTNIHTNHSISTHTHSNHLHQLQHNNNSIPHTTLHGASSNEYPPPHGIPAMPSLHHLNTNSIPYGGPSLSGVHSGSTSNDLHSLAHSPQSNHTPLHQHYRGSASHGAFQFANNPQYQMQLQMQMFQAMGNMNMSSTNMNMNTVNGVHGINQMQLPLPNTVLTQQSSSHTSQSFHGHSDVPPPLSHARSMGDIHQKKSHLQSHQMMQKGGSLHGPYPPPPEEEEEEEEEDGESESSTGSYSSGSESASYISSEDEDDGKKDMLPTTNVHSTHSTEAMVPPQQFNLHRVRSMPPTVGMGMGMNTINEMNGMEVVDGMDGIDAVNVNGHASAGHTPRSAQIVQSNTRLTPDVSPTGSHCSRSVSPQHSPFAASSCHSNSNYNHYLINNGVGSSLPHSHSSIHHSPLDQRNGSLMSNGSAGSAQSNQSYYSNSLSQAVGGPPHGTGSGQRQSNGFPAVHGPNGKRFSNQSNHSHSSASRWSQSNQSLSPHPNRNSYSQNTVNRRQHQISRSTGLPSNYTLNKVINISPKKMPSKPLPSVNSNHRPISSGGFTKSALSPTGIAEEEYPSNQVQSVDDEEDEEDQDDDEETISMVTSLAEAQQLNVANKEDYLTDALFWSIFKMTKADYNALRPWKRKQLKRDAGLF